MMKWSISKQIELEELAKAGLTAQCISDELSERWQQFVTRNMVIGRMNRTDVKFTHGIKSGSRRQRVRLVKLGIPITELTLTTCRWPLWPEKTQAHLYCGATVKGKGVYCSEHMRLSMPHSNLEPRASFTQVNVPSNPPNSIAV
jgi:hypothetical protein